ncbi:MAG: hypothetical protein EA342_02850 [Leptolyngbya sp. LCM1.Bin17]|nr:MAG: hypothetical protein EA342_02850 [Leptolyngbya sp. LCM1.Bin17]
MLKSLTTTGGAFCMGERRAALSGRLCQRSGKAQPSLGLWGPGLRWMDGLEDNALMNFNPLKTIL